jgi:alpha-N-arabinofuranosidase
MERNSDLVVMHCYAPLFVNVNPGGRQWRPDMIGYDALHSFGSPSYHAFRMFSTHVGNQILKVDRTDSTVFASATRASATGEIFLKLVNPHPTVETELIEIQGTAHVDSGATVISLSSSSSQASNTIENPAAVTPHTSVINGVRSGFSFPVPGNGIVVLILKSERQ